MLFHSTEFTRSMGKSGSAAAFNDAVHFFLEGEGGVGYEAQHSLYGEAPPRSPTPTL